MRGNNPGSSYIGVFDSGVGGLTVVEKLLHYLPKESILYYGDTARCPYGDKSKDTIARYSLDNLSFLEKHPLKAVVVACGTATACALGALQARTKVPLISVAQKSVVRHALSRTKNGHIAILATARTIASGYYQDIVTSIAPLATVTPVACPQFVPLIENEAPTWQIHDVVAETLEPLQKQDVDTIILGCTHYPLIAHMIQEELSHATLVDLANSAAQAVLETLFAKGTLYAREELPQHKIIFSGDTPPIGRRFLDALKADNTLSRV